jgi:hypothetical protein
LESAKSKLALVEAEWKLLTGEGERERAALALVDVARQEEFFRALAALRSQQHGAAPKAGPVSERIRAALDKSVKLGAKGHSVSVKAALERFDLGIAVRGLDDLGNSNFETVGEELPVGAWLIYIQDTFGLTAHVREYGILFAKKENAPADAVTLAQFWKQKPTAEPAPKK